MSTNASYEYIAAEKAYLKAKNIDEKIICLEEMIKTAPKHKGSENMLAELKTRLKKLREKAEKASKKLSGKKGIKKEGYQVVLVGLPNSGRSSLLARLTNAKPQITQHPFTTKHAEIGTLDYEGIKAQIVDIPSIGSEFFDIGIVNTADCILVVIENLEDIEKVRIHLTKVTGKTIIAINKSDLLSDEQLRKLQEKVKSRKLNAIIISSLTGYGLKDLKEAILKNMQVIRVYTKEPGKLYSQIPIVLKQGATIKDVAESIRKGFSQIIKETRLTGPSSKFPNQKVGLNHVLKDKDIVEFHTR